MSSSYGPEVSYHCLNDCRQEGCPGHTIRFVRYNTVDVGQIWEAGKVTRGFDLNELDAIVESYTRFKAEEEQRRGSRRGA